MLRAVPDFVAPSTRVQVLGRVAVHHEGESQRLTGSAQRLLAVMVAAGPDGATAERIAEEIWAARQPDPWRPALRMAIARLRKQLPPGWDLVADGGFYRIATTNGWVDAWRLESAASAGAPIAEEDLAWMLAGKPFGDIDLLELVGASTQSLEMLQVTMAERFCTQHPKSVSTATCALLTGLVRDHPYSDRLALVVAQTLALAGRRTEGIMALSTFAESYASEIGSVPADISRFLASGGDEDIASAAATELAPAERQPIPIAKELRQLAEGPLLGRTVELDKLQASGGALVTGPTGAGKSRLLAALIVEDPETETTYVVGDDLMDLPLGSFAVAMPKLRDELLSSAHEDSLSTREERSAEQAASTRAWRIVLAHLERRSALRRQRLVVDDAHLLDPASSGLLRLLIRSNTTADVTFVVCGRNDFDDPEWQDLVRDAERAGLDPIELEGFDVGEIELMVFEQFPDATHLARQGLALDVHEASGGLPAVAAPLIALAAPGTLALPEQLSGVSPLARVTASLSERAPEVVAAAAVLGHQFSIGALIALTELDESSIFRVLDELWTTGLIIETDDPDKVRFRHVLIRRAFLEAVPLFRRGQLHRRAAELADNPHDRADHQVNASALVPAETTAQSLRESAVVFAERRSWRKVAREVRRIDDLAGEHLDAATLTLWAQALDCSGADGSAHRRRAYSLAVEAEQWEAALDAALSGLPETESPGGDRERIEMLEGIPSHQLPEERRFDRVHLLGRQYSLVGRDNEAVLRCSDEALDLAVGPVQTVLAHVLRWMATRHSGANPHQVTANEMFDANPEIRMRIAQINAINLAEAGDLEAAERECEKFAEMAAVVGDPLRMWHAQGLRGSFLLGDARFEEAEALALENLQFADLHDLQLGIANYIGQQVFSYDQLGKLEELHPRLAPFRSDLETLAPGRAALLLSGRAAGKEYTPSEVRSIVEDAHDRPGNSVSLMAILLVNRFLLADAPDLVPRTKARLEQFGDNPLLAGFGAVSMGPTSRYVAQLTVDLRQRAEVIDHAIAAADRQGALLWRVRTRLDRAELGSTEALEQAVELAQGTELAPVVARSIETPRA